MSTKVLLLFFILIIIPLVTIHGQVETKDLNALEDIATLLADMNDDDDEMWQQSRDILTDMAATPQNINTATFEELSQVPFISEDHALAILHYRSLYGDLKNMGELTMITALPALQRHVLQAIYYAQPSENKGKKSLLDGKHSIVGTLSIPTYTREGYVKGKYLGVNANHSLRYNYRSQHIQAAFTAAQDYGEQFFIGSNVKGWDFYTGYVQLKDIRSLHLKSLIVGHYQVSAGMGLIMNNDYRLTRTALLTSTPHTGTSVRGHSSKSESNYLQGIAATVSLGRRWDITAFASLRYIDATMNDDSTAIRTILTTGYHRTQSEINRHNSSSQRVLGATVAFSSLPFRLALTVLNVQLGDSIIPDKRQEYRRYYPWGRSFTSASLSYSFIRHNLEVVGETAVSSAAQYDVKDIKSKDAKTYKTSDNDERPSIATVNSISWKPSSDWRLFLLHRFYDYRFLSLLSNSFGDVSNSQNESGIYLGATTTKVRHMTLSAYVDGAYHPWQRYGYSGPSRTFDMYVSGTYALHGWDINARYRYREQVTTDQTTIMPQFSKDMDGNGQHTLRLSSRHESTHWTHLIQAQLTSVPTAESSGYLLSYGIGYSRTKRLESANSRPRSKSLRLWGSVTYFATDDYTSRLYLTDRNVTYGSTSSMVYGRGWRLNVIASYDILHNLTATFRAVTVRYLDRDEISSGDQRIAANSQTDLHLQLAWKF